MKELICKAFCASLEVRSVPGGYAVETPYPNADGDPILIYYMQEIAGSRWRIEDDGTQVPLLEANGVDLAGQSRGEALEYLLEEYGGLFDNEARTIRTDYLREDELGTASIKFIALLLRVQDLALLSPQIIRNTFRNDVIAAIRTKFGDTAKIDEDVAVSSSLPAFRSDVVISADGQPSIAVYIATTEERGLQALVLKMEMEKYRQISSRIVLLVERAKQNPLRESTYALAQARLDDVLAFRGVESDAMDKLAKDFRENETRH